MAFLLVRQALVDALGKEAEAGGTLFALEGGTGVGKSTLLSELAMRLASGKYCDVNCAQRASERLAIADIYRQLRAMVQGDEGVVSRLQERVNGEVAGQVRKVFGAILADLLRLATDKAEKTIDVVQEIASGSDERAGIVAQLEALDGDSQRFFILEFLKDIVAAGATVVIAFDNVDAADASLIALLRYLIKEKPGRATVLLAFNSESGDNGTWDNVLADLRARGGLLREIAPLNSGEIAALFLSDVGRLPTPSELGELKRLTHGRVHDVTRALSSQKAAGGPPPDYRGYYENLQSTLGGEASVVAELLALLQANTLVSQEILAKAAQRLGIENLGRALVELRKHRLIRRDEGRVGFSHSIAGSCWLEMMSELRIDALSDAWLQATLTGGPMVLSSPDGTGLLPAIAPLLSGAIGASGVGSIGAQLIEVGSIDSGLDLIDRAWQLDKLALTGGEGMIEHALVAARTRLRIGRYSEVDEPLTQAEIAAEGNESQLQEIALIRMELALRRNTYAALWPLGKRLKETLKHDDLRLIDSELLINTALRDIGDREEMALSCKRLEEMRVGADSVRECAIDRALARTLAKLGDVEPSLSHAQSALRSSSERGAVRAIGNSYLALGEAHRYRSEGDAAVEAYRSGAEVARAIGNRDSLLWSLLGEAATYIDGGVGEKANRPLAELEALLGEPGYTHPIEAAHTKLLRVLQGKPTSEDSEVLAMYDSLRLRWPERYLADRRKQLNALAPIPL